MASLNRIVLIGQLVDSPELRSGMEGTAMAKFKLTVARPAGAGSDLIDIVAWKNLAEAAGQQLKKGDLALVEGRIQIRTFQNQSGERNWATEVVATSLHPLGARQAPTFSSSGQASPSGGQAVHAAPDEGEVEELPEDDLPF